MAEQVSGFVADSGKKDNNSESNMDVSEDVNEDALPPTKKSKLEGNSTE